MSKTNKGCRNKFLNWKEALESKGLKVNLGKTKLMVSGGITKNGMSKSKVDSLRAKAKSAWCVQCGKLIYGRCAGVKRMTPKISRNFTCEKCEENIAKTVEQEEKL